MTVDQPRLDIHQFIPAALYYVEWKPEDIKNPRFSTVAEHHHLEWLMRHSKEEESQLALPKLKKKSSCTMIMVRLSIKNNCH